jgi:hypothetical protein
MSKQVKLRRGTATEHNTFTGVVGEVTVDTTNRNLRVHDGATAGGRATARADGVGSTGTHPISITGNAATASALSGTLGLSQGGTGQTTAGGARVALGAAASGANTDITSLNQSTNITETGAILATSLGFRGVPQVVQAAGYTLTAADAGRHIAISSGNITIPSNAALALPIGTTIVIYNNSAVVMSILITTDTLRLAGTATTGTRSLAQYGMASLIKVASNQWAASGAGLT